jgi:pilus assembly protein CpaE
MSRFLLASTDETFERRVRLAFGGALNGDFHRIGDDLSAVKPAKAVDRMLAAAGGDPEVVALGPGLPTDAALALAQQLDHDRPEISVLLVAEPGPEVWAQALRAGVRDVLAPDAPAPDLREAFERARQTAARRRANLTVQPDAAADLARIITVVSPKGGSGKTTVTTNVAVSLALAHPGEVVLVDADVQFGDVAGALQLAPDHGLGDAARLNGALDAMALKVFLTEHTSGLYALCAPESPAEGEDISGEQLAHVLKILASEFRYVLIDTSAGLLPQTLAALEVSTDLLVVCSMDVPSVRSMKKALESLDALGMTMQRHFVLNRADSKVGMDAEDIERTLGLPVNVALPSSRTVPLSLNQGIPLVQAEAHSRLAREIGGLARRFESTDPDAVAPEPAAGGLGRLLSRRSGR